MKKTNLSYIIIFFVLFAGCKKSFVSDVVSPSQISLDGYYTSQSAFDAGLSGIYGTLRARYDNIWRMAEVPSDNSLAVGSVIADTGPLDQFSWSASDANVLREWQGDYQTIAYCNNYLDQIKDFPLNDSLKKRWTGEAKFVRALMYFNLVRFYGAVPLVIKKVQTDEESYSYDRAPVADVYNQIVKDLQDAEGVLPSKYTLTTDVGRVTSGAAKALLGKVYLTQNRWDDAAVKLGELIALNTYSLVPLYSDLFSITNETNAEAIFSVQYTKGTVKEGSNFTVNFLPNRTPLLITLTPKGSNQGTKNLFDAFETGDTRKATAVQLYGTYYTRKFMDNPPAEFEGENNWMVLRYADVLLMYAEALEEQNSLSQSIIQLNKVRARAGLPAVAANTTQANLRLAIEKERRVELCFEGHRWFDLVRTGRMVAVMKAQFLADGLAYTVVPERALFPIPFRDITLNPKLTQNPGY